MRRPRAKRRNAPVCTRVRKMIDYDTEEFDAISAGGPPPDK